MAIEVTCVNGHALRVKDKYAGKSGLCPRCHVRVDVPAAEGISDDHVLFDAGHPAAASDRYASDDYVHQDPRHNGEPLPSGVSLIGSSILRRKKVCVGCGKETSFSFTYCPVCASALSVPAPPPVEYS